MENIKKYLLFAFILENIAVQTMVLGAFANTVFYILIPIGVLFLFSKEIVSTVTMRTCWWAYALSAIYIFYEFIVGSEYISSRTIFYICGKITTFVIILVGIRKNYEFYAEKMLFPLAVFLTFFIVYGLVTGQGMSADMDRMRLGYTNENTTSWMGAFVVGCILFSKRRWDWKSIIIVTIGIFGVLAGASRAGMLFLSILVVVRYGLKMNIVFPLIAGYAIAVFLLPAIGLNTVGLQRMQDTLTGVEESNRDVEREAAEMMIREKPYTGWGFEAHNVGTAADISELGSHNGYLETLKFMGYPMGGFWIFIIFYASAQVLLGLRRSRIKYGLFEAYILSLLICAMFEDLFTGVHEFATNFFIISLAISSFKLNRNSRKYFRKFVTNFQFDRNFVFRR